MPAAVSIGSGALILLCLLMPNARSHGIPATASAENNMSAAKEED